MEPCAEALLPVVVELHAQGPNSWAGASETHPEAFAEIKRIEPRFKKFRLDNFALGFEQHCSVFDARFEAYSSGFWQGTIRVHDFYCSGYDGSLPVVKRHDAELWLKESVRTAQPNFNPAKMVHDIAIVYWREMPEGYQARSISRADAQRIVEKLMSRTFDRKTFKTAIENYSPEGKKVKLEGNQ